MEMKRRKGLSVIIGLLIVIMLAGYICVIAGAKNVEKMMWEYLEAGGYRQEEIKSIKVYHSLLNPLFSHNRWTIRVSYADEPAAIYLYTVEDGRIKDAGVSGSVDKDNLKHKE